MQTKRRVRDFPLTLTLTLMTTQFLTPDSTGQQERLHSSEVLPFMLDWVTLNLG